MKAWKTPGDHKASILWRKPVRKGKSVGAVVQLNGKAW